MQRSALPGARTPPAMPRTPPAAARITRHATRSRSIQKMTAERFISPGFLDSATNARNDEVLLIASLSAVLFQDAKHEQPGLASVDRLGRRQLGQYRLLAFLRILHGLLLFVPPDSPRVLCISAQSAVFVEHFEEISEHGIFHGINV